MEKHLHIICLDVPYPPDYGGVFDLFYKLRYLKERGVQVILHCFEYGRGQQTVLNEYCTKVFYYKRKTGIQSISFTIPYIVKSRVDKRLLQNLSADNYPVLLEGTHCTFLLWKNKLKDRKVLLRLHNIETDYYLQMTVNTDNLFRKLYYWNECRLLKKYEPCIMRRADSILTVSEKDAKQLKSFAKQVDYLPVFTGWNNITSRPGTGNYCLYHGNLSVAENESAALWLIESVFPELKIPLKIAGKNPSQKLINAASGYLHIEIISNPADAEMEHLINEAQINLLPSFSSTGVKLKLLHAVFCGRYCIVNKMTAEGTGLETTCIFAENEKDFQDQINLVYHTPFTQTQIEIRKNLLQLHYNNGINADKLIAMM